MDGVDVAVAVGDCDWYRCRFIAAGIAALAAAVAVAAGYLVQTNPKSISHQLGSLLTCPTVELGALVI